MRELTVREARERKRLTQEQLAAESGIDQSTISDLETGRHTNPRLTTVQRLADALGIAPSRLRFTKPDETVREARDRSGHGSKRRKAAGAAA